MPAQIAYLLTSRVLWLLRARSAAGFRALAALIATAVAATAQPTGPNTAAGPAPTVGAGEITIKLDRFGVGNISRAGEWVGVRVTLNDALSKQRTVLVRLATQDTDGDTPVFQREMTTNPGADQPLWLYARVPYGYPGGTELVVSAFEAIEIAGGGAGGAGGVVGGAGAGDAGTPFRAGRLLGRLVLAPNSGSVQGPTMQVLGVLGQRPLGLLGYGVGQYGGRDGLVHPWDNEPCAVQTGLTPGDVPDRWMGLAPFDVIVWGQGKPEDLRGERARALRDWIVRGGHLVVVMPAAGQTWTTPASNELFDTMPAVAITRSEAEPMAKFRSMLTRPPPSTQSGFDSYPASATVHFFQPLADADPNQAMRVLAAPPPDGRAVVVRRLVGAGAVTLVGIDLNNTAFSQFGQVDTDVFWHRVLGRRGDYSAPAAVGVGATATIPPPPPREKVIYDEFFGRSINQTGRSAVGVLLGFVVFAAYWVVAGPGGFALLKRKGRAQHAWLGFVAAGVAFTGLAWSGASLLRPRHVDLTHVTFLDHTYGQPTNRARVWGSVLIPWYGQATLSVGEDRLASGGPAIESHHSLSAVCAWDPDEEQGATTTFPDARGYIVDARAPDTMTFPSRSTVKQFRADWAGGPRWRMPIPLGDDGVSAGTIRLLRPVGAASDASGPLVRGTLVHGLPGPLADVTMVVVGRQRPLAPSLSMMPAQAEVYRISGDWKPGEQLDLGSMTVVPTQGTAGQRQFEQWIATLNPRASALVGVPASSPVADDAMLGLAFYSMLPTPDRTTQTSQVAPLRKHAHGWDLGRWFTQPCVIVVGRLVNNETPVPVAIDGKLVKGRGTTVVRWVYPLPDNPPDYPGVAADAKGGGGGGGSGRGGGGP